MSTGPTAACLQKTLHEALRAIGLDPSEQLYVNLFRDPPAPLEVDPKALEDLARHRLDGGPVIALGKKVAAYLERCGIQHVALVHPAARGSIRRTENYQAHVAAMLLAGEAPLGSHSQLIRSLLQSQPTGQK